MATPGPGIVPDTAFVEVVVFDVLATIALPVELEATIALPVPLCTTPTIWSVVEPLKLVGPAVAANLDGELLLPLPAVACVEAEPEMEATPAAELVPFTSFASTKSERLLPASVSASCALRAYGTLTSSTRGCSACPCTCTASQRCSSCEKR